MFQSNTLTRFRRHLLVGAVAAAAIVPAAGAVNRPPDVQDAANASLVAHMSPPDVRDAALGASVVVPDVIERYAAAHPYGFGLPAKETSVSRPPDIVDAALTAQYGSSVHPGTNFSWGDWAIGIGSGLGMALLLGAGLATSRQFRQRLRTA
jgi:hypothetical protein